VDLLDVIEINKIGLIENKMKKTIKKEKLIKQVKYRKDGTIMFIEFNRPIINLKDQKEFLKILK
jgi:hypothetical protein